MYEANISGTANAATEIAYAIYYLTLGFQIEDSVYITPKPILGNVPEPVLSNS
jgi:hypothetical protein